MTTFADIINNDIGVVFLSDFGVEITYTPEGGAAKIIRALIEDEFDGIPHPTQVNIKFKERRMRISALNNTVGQESPKRLGLDGASGDEVTFTNGEKWYVVEVEQNGRVNMSMMHTIILRNRKLALK